MSPVMEAAALAGRLLLSALFLHEAWSKLTAYAAAMAYMQAFGVPGQLLPLAIAVELGSVRTADCRQGQRAKDTGKLPRRSKLRSGSELARHPRRQGPDELRPAGMGGFKLSGFAARALWSVAHTYFLIG
jgi:hypothetical protein